MKRFFLFFSLFILLAGAGVTYYVYQQYQLFLNQPIALESATINFEVKPGSHIRQVAEQLTSANIFQPHELIKPEWFFEGHARLTKQANKIKAGEYILEQDMNPADVLARIVSGKTLQYQISFIEGQDFGDIVEAVKSHPDLVHTLTDEDYANIMVKLGAPEGTRPEGWFFPDTYHFPRDTTDLEVLQRSYNTMRDYLQKAWNEGTPSPHLKSPYDVLILASIVEKETGVADERPLIAQVFLNRLEKDMLLQTDPTVIYGMGDAYDGNIRKRDLRKDTPYNTYTRKGLTPTPIATPSKAAIDAVLNPEETDALFFVATGLGDGRHYFSKTYAEHKRAVIKYQLNGKSSRYQGDK